MSIALTHCDGTPVTESIEHLSVMLRPWSASKPAHLPAKPPAGQEWAPGVKAVDPGLLTRLQKVATNYKGKKISIVSGYRPGSIGSYHKDARAMDFKVEGVKNEDLVTFCRGLEDTGCGYYPNSSFVHMDVRPKGTGHVYWIDASGPGEAARYVSQWPPPKGQKADEIKKPDHAAPGDEQTHGDFHRKDADTPVDGPTDGGDDDQRSERSEKSDKGEKSEKNDKRSSND